LDFQSYDGIRASNPVNFIVRKIDAEPQAASVHDEKVISFFLANGEAKLVDPEASSTIEVKSSYRYE
jgi:hypothetical protein